MLAWSFGEIELVSHVLTMLSHLIQACTFEGVDTNGDERVKVPSMKPSLFLVSKAFLNTRAQAAEFSPPINGCVTRTKLGFSTWCKNRRSSIRESCEEEEDGFIDVEASVEPFAFVVEAIDGNWRMNFPRIEFSQEQKRFSRENWEKEKLKLKEMQNPTGIQEFALIPYHRIKD